MVTSVRIRGIDAPEIKGACALESCLALHARAALNSFILDGADTRRRRLVSCGHGKYFRYVCDVLNDGGRRASDAMLQSGLAMAWNGRGIRPVDWCVPARIPQPRASPVKVAVAQCLAS